MKSPSGQRRLILRGVKSFVARTLQRGNAYGLPDDRREMRFARYFAMRIDREATREDHPITKRILAGNGGHTQRRASETRANNQAIVTPLYFSSW
jgi:hypothetical protein